MTSGSAIVVSDLSRRFGDMVAVRGVSFTVEEGALFGIVGADGAGKTTMLRMLAGVLRPSGGDAMIYGVSVARDPEGVKTDTAYMSQRFGLYTDLTVSENIAFYADLYRVPREVRRERLDRVYAFSGLGPFQSRLAGDLSGGMKQKLSLSCALIHQPRLLLLDEPTFGVDPISRRDLWLIIHEMVADGTTVVTSTAYLDEAERCDRVLLLHEGRVLGLDAPRVLQDGLEGRVFEVSGGSVAMLTSVLESSPGVASVARYGDTLRVTHQSPEALPTLRRVLESSTHADEPTPLLRQVDPSLEDVFVDRLTREAHSEGDGRDGEEVIARA